MINNVVKLIWQHFILCKRQVPFAEKYSILFHFLRFFSLYKLYHLGKASALSWWQWLSALGSPGKAEEQGWEMERGTQRSFTTFKGLGKSLCSAGSSCRALWKCQSWDTHGTTVIMRLKQGKTGDFSEASSKLRGQRAPAQLQAVLSIDFPALGWMLTCVNTPFTSKQVCSKASFTKSD